MILSKVLSKYQITLPKEAVQALHIQKGHVLKCQIDHGTIRFTPVIVEEPYSKEELEAFNSLYNDSKNKGSVYKTKADALAHLKRLHAKH